MLFGLRMLPSFARLGWSALEKGAALDDRSAAEAFSQAVGPDYVDVMLRATLDSLALSPAAEVSA